MKIARGTRDWVKHDGWMYEYALFCLATNFATVGAIASAYALGQADRAIGELARERAQTIRLPGKTVIYG